MQIVKYILAALMVLFAQLQVLPPFADPGPKVLGTPTESYYAEKQRLSCSVWDMELHDGVLYIGAGDYSANTGPTPIWAYDTANENWSLAVTVEDEAVSRFCTIGETLAVPGIDATGNSWKYGNYHTLTDGQWTTFEKLPGAVHDFDVTAYIDTWFFALGTADGETSPVLSSTDGQTDFRSVPFYRDGEDLLDGRFSFTRVYDFFAVNESLYCFFCGYADDVTATRLFCRYENGAFYAINEAELDFDTWKQMPVMGKSAAGSVQYFTTGTLYRTEDFLHITPVALPDGGTVTDLYTYSSGQRQLLYALSNVKNSDGTYTATVYLLEETAAAVAAYTSSAPALSFVRCGMYFYLGLGGSEKFPETGSVIRLSVFDRSLNS